MDIRTASQPVDTRKIGPIRGVALHATIRGSGPVTVNGDNPGDRGEEERGLNNWSHFGGIDVGDHLKMYQDFKSNRD